MNFTEWADYLGFDSVDAMKNALDLSCCEHCGASQTRMVPAMTAYHWDGQGEDPNRDVELCTDCAEEHVAYWNAMWDEYYQGLL